MPQRRAQARSIGQRAHSCTACQGHWHTQPARQATSLPQQWSPWTQGYQAHLCRPAPSVNPCSMLACGTAGLINPHQQQLQQCQVCFNTTHIHIATTAAGRCGDPTR
jgi:hypothetical protein